MSLFVGLNIMGKCGLCDMWLGHNIDLKFWPYRCHTSLLWVKVFAIKAFIIKNIDRKCDKLGNEGLQE